jgi:signal transduction histidine kinase
MLRIAVGNLIRNAVENTSEGCIEVSIQDGVICISDPGKGFDPVEAARRYRDSLRAAMPIRGQGLGLFLISRICDRFGWHFSIENLPMNGTRARLDVSASSLIDTDAA